MKKQKRYFNMIEVILALGIIAIGVTGILAILPPAVKAARDGIAENNAANAATGILTYLEMYVQGQWRAGTPPSTGGTPAALTKADPDTLPSGDLVDTINSMDIYNLPSGNFAIIKKEGDTSVFAAEARVKYEVIADFANAGSLETIGTDYAIRMILELSWPLNMAGELREKSYYVKEIFNHNPPTP